MKITEFNLASSNKLFDICQKAIQIKSSIETIAITNQISLDAIPASIIDTKDLYEVLAGYTALFDKCLANDLIKSGSKLHYKNRIQ